MTQRVPMIPPRLYEGSSTLNTVRAGMPVLGAGHWSQWAQAANWLGGAGGSLAFAGPDGAAITAGSSAYRRFYCWPRTHHETWVWVVEFQASSESGAHGTVAVTPGGNVFEWSVPDSDSRTITFLHDPSSVADGEATIQILVDAESASSVTVRSVGLYEMPRVFLDLGPRLCPNGGQMPDCRLRIRPLRAMAHRGARRV